MDDSSDIEETDSAEPQAATDDVPSPTDQGAEQLPAPGSASLSAVSQDLLPRQAKPYMGAAAEEQALVNPQNLENVAGTPADTPPSGFVEIKNAHQLLKALDPYYGTFVPKAIRAITKSGDDAMVLSQILYWFDYGKDGRPRARKMIGVDRYMYKTHAALGSELGIPAGRVKASLKRLRKAGFIEIQYKLADGGRTSHIRPLIPNITAATTKALSKLATNPDSEQAK